MQHCLRLSGVSMACWLPRKLPIMSCLCCPACPAQEADLVVVEVSCGWQGARRQASCLVAAPPGVFPPGWLQLVVCCEHSSTLPGSHRGTGLQPAPSFASPHYSSPTTSLRTSRLTRRRGAVLRSCCASCCACATAPPCCCCTTTPGGTREAAHPLQLLPCLGRGCAAVGTVLLLLFRHRYDSNT